MTKLARVCLAAALAAGVVGFGGGRMAIADDAPAAAAKGDSVDFRKLKELLPAELAGIKRAEASGEKNKLGDFSVSMARATYRAGKEDDEKAARIEIEITDYGTGGGAQLGAAVAAVWTNADIDKESDSGYEKTVKVGDGKFPGYEEWQKESKHGSLQVSVAKRYVVVMRADNLPAGEVVKLAGQLPLAKLAELK